MKLTQKQMDEFQAKYACLNLTRDERNAVIALFEMVKTLRKRIATLERKRKS